MNKSLLTFIFLVFSAGLFAQSPNAFNYQAALRDNQGALLNNQFVGLKIEIENSTGIVYAEEYVVQTNAFGIINVQVGVNPSSSSNTFADIDWALGPYSLKTYVDPNGGQSYQFNSSSDILSVPYANYSQKSFLAQTAVDVDDADSDPTNEHQFISLSNDTLYLTNGGYVILPQDNVNDADHDTLNEIQTLNMSGNTITLSDNGGSVNVFDGDFYSLTNVPVFDTSNNNELQVLNISGDTLFLTNGGYVLLPSDNWSELNGVVFRNSQVGINTSTPTGQLEVSSLPNAANNAIGISITRQTNSNGWGIPLRFYAFDINNQHFRYSQIAGGILNNVSKTGFLSFGVANGSPWGVNYEQEKMRLTPIGLGIGVTSPQRDLHIAGLMRLSPLQSSPPNGTKGDLYINSDGEINYYNGTNWVNTTQQLSLVGDTLFLSDANYVVLPQNSMDSSLNDLEDAISTQTVLALGQNALNSTSTATANTAVGTSAMHANTTGEGNVAMGTNAMYFGQTGSHNAAYGFHALHQNVAGSRNNAFGSRSMQSSTAGSDNNSFGTQALYQTTGNGNNAMGNGALYGTTTGGLNNAIGYNALSGNTTGSGNTALGHDALKANTTGSNNVAIGKEANVASSNLSNAIAIGYQATVANSNQIQLGNSSLEKVQTSGALVVGNPANTNQQYGLTVYGSTNGPYGPSGQFFRDASRNNVLTFHTLDTTSSASIGLIGGTTNYIAIGAYNTTKGWSSPLTIDLSASTKSIDIGENGKVSLNHRTLVKSTTDTTSINDAAALEVRSTTKGFLPPRMLESERDAISSPPAGLIVYCSNCGIDGQIQVFNGNTWTDMCGGTAATIPQYGLYDTGYYGGIVFYINPNFAIDGWKYLELYPQQFAAAKWQFDSIVASSPYYFNIQTVSSLGGGWSNKQLMSGYSPLAQNQNIPNEQIWYVPSLLELQTIYSRVAGILQALGQNAGSNSIFHSGQFWMNFWTSTQSDQNNAYRINFNGGATHTSSKSSQMPFLLITKY